MKKLLFRLCMLLIFTTIGTSAFAQNEFRYRGDAEISVFRNEPPLMYIFYNADVNSIEDMLSLGLFIGSWYGKGSGRTGNIYGSPRMVSRNNRDLSQAVKEKMRTLGANISITIYDGDLFVNILLSNGTYTTIIYEP